MCICIHQNICIALHVARATLKPVIIYRHIYIYVYCVCIYIYMCVCKFMYAVGASRKSAMVCIRICKHVYITHRDVCGYIDAALHDTQRCMRIHRCRSMYADRYDRLYLSAYVNIFTLYIDIYTYMYRHMYIYRAASMRRAPV